LKEFEIPFIIYDKFDKLTDMDIEHKIRNEFLAKWYWRIVFPNKFGQSPKENAKNQFGKMSNLIKNICEKIESNTFDNEEELSELKNELDNITIDYRELDQQDLEDLPDGRNITPLNLLPYEHHGSAYNLKSGKTDKLRSDKSKMNIHHIFPESLATKKRLVKKTKIDNPLNMLLIDAELNKHIKNKYPFEYLTGFKNDYDKKEPTYSEILQSNYLPEILLNPVKDDDLEDFYDTYLSERAKIILTQINILQGRLTDVSNIKQKINTEINEERAVTENIKEINFDDIKIVDEILIYKSHIRNKMNISNLNIADDAVKKTRYLTSEFAIYVLRRFKTAIELKKYLMENFDIDIEDYEIPRDLANPTLLKRIFSYAETNWTIDYSDLIKILLQLFIESLTKLAEELAKQDKRKTILLRDILDLNAKSVDEILNSI
jgi:histone H3/H4